MITEDSGLWEEVLSGREESFIPRILRNSVRYLTNARDSHRGWPPYPGLPSDLHCSCVAIEALRAISDDDDTYEVPIAEAASFIRDEYGGKASGGSIEELLDLMTVSISEEDKNSEYASALHQQFQAAFHAANSGNRTLSTQILSRALYISTQWSNEDQLSLSLLSLVLKRQRAQTGAWSQIEGSDEDSISATAWAVRAISKISTKESNGATSNGLQYIKSQLVDRGWEGACAGGGLLTTAVVLRAVSAVDLRDDLDLVDSGVEYLRSQINPDGGWGGGTGEVSSVEHTAAAVVALAESGENKFVPVRITRETVNALQSQVAEIASERDSLTEDFEGRILEHCGRVKRERDDFRKRVRQAEARASELEEAVAQLQRGIAERDHERLSLMSTIRPAQLMNRRGISRSERLLCIPIFILLGVTVAAPYVLKSTEIAAIVSSVSILALVLLFLYWFRRVTYRRNSFLVDRLMAEQLLFEPSLKPHRRVQLDILLDSFRYATEDFPPSIREELVYRLLRDGVDIPQDIGSRYIRELMLDLHIPPRRSQGLEAWLERVMSLDPDNRRILFSQLRRAIL
ncbi:prenyltransferase/squalene oxidase repeat-containing protein [Streptomyces graminofaciens]|uniref:prenyltransferase/squalene oxidase repeat-containing protein n=1 Tax=Streptomyces graminofaciens TaxID=68212 RepID=UPI002573F7B2|nr:prenyltransferase/squalene oxidase repeat-containing protein [Streptomyces graminofaciens]